MERPIYRVRWYLSSAPVSYTHLDVYKRQAVDIIVGAEDVKIEKPDPEGLLIAAGYFGVGKEHVLYVGDSTVDAKTAENAKIDFAAVLTGATTAAELEQFSHVCIAEDLYGVYQFACR